MPRPSAGTTTFGIVEVNTEEEAEWVKRHCTTYGFIVVRDTGRTHQVNGQEENR